MLDSKAPRFNLDSRVIVITGVAGLLGRQHAIAIAELGGIPVVLDIDSASAQRVACEIEETYAVPALAGTCDITDEKSVKLCLEEVLGKRARIDGLINNAANNEKMEQNSEIPNHRLENITIETWQKDFEISVTGAFLCSRIIGPHMAENNGGVILNISSDLGIIAPDQRVYYKDGIPPNEQIVKPVTYSVIKHALIGLTKYLSTYWIDKNIRVNALCPGGVYSGQPKSIVDQLEYRIPLGRMATIDEYKAAIVFLISDASAYMNGATVVMDGGRSTW